MFTLHLHCGSAQAGGWQRQKASIDISNFRHQRLFCCLQSTVTKVYCFSGLLPAAAAGGWGLHRGRSPVEEGLTLSCLRLRAAPRLLLVALWCAEPRQLPRRVSLLVNITAAPPISLLVRTNPLFPTSEYSPPTSIATSSGFRTPHVDTCTGAIRIYMYVYCD